MAVAVTTRGEYPPRLLDTYLAIARRSPRRSLPAAALRTRSLSVRRLLAHAALGQPDSLTRLVAAASNGAPGRRDVRPDQVDPTALAELAQVISLQEILPEDSTVGLALYDLALGLFGVERAMSAEHQGVHAQLAYHLGDNARASSLLAMYRRVPDHVRACLDVDLANPFVHEQSRPQIDWLEAFQRLMPAPHPSLRPGDIAPFNRLTSDLGISSATSDQVSVVMTAFRPDPGIVTAVESLVRQSWANIEILIIDDGSPPDFDAFLRRCVESDPRVRLIRLPTNVGTYAARNAGLDAATGRFVTFQDADDWSHPRRIEAQIQPLLRDRALMATTSDGLRVDDALVLTRPGRTSRVMNTSSILFRREAVVERLGYFDPVRKAADGEFVRRLQSVYGDGSVERLQGEIYSLIRQSSDSLSRDEFRAGWMDPARTAYRSAYQLWHEQIKVGKAEPFLPKDLTDRPFAAPSALMVGSGPPTRYDVVVVDDWRALDGVHASVVDEIRALANHGQRVAVMQLESFRFMTRERISHDRSVQELINAGVVDEILPTDRVEASLLLVRYPPVLMFEPATPSRVRPDAVVIVASRAPVSPDGGDHRYSPDICAQAARRLFGVEPVWCPQGRAARQSLAAHVDEPAVTAFDAVPTIDADRWRVDRNGFRSDVAVLGRHSRDSAAAWPADPATILQVYPGSRDLDVRMLGGAATARAALGPAGLPANWLVYDVGEVSVRSFLYQIDFFVYFPNLNAIESPGRGVLEALASACVVIVPEDFRDVLGDAAVFAEPAEVPSIVRRLRSSREAFLEQSRRGAQWVRDHNGPEQYLGTLLPLLSRT